MASDPSAVLRATRGFMRGLAARLLEHSSRPNAFEYLIAAQTEISEFIEARRFELGLATMDPSMRTGNFLPQNEMAYFAQPRSAYDYTEHFDRPYETSRRYIAKAIEVGDLFSAGTRPAEGRGRPTQLYCSDRKTALFQLLKQSKG